MDKWIQQNLDIEEGWAPQLIDFEDIALGANTEDQYEELGVHLSGGLYSLTMLKVVFP